MSELSLVQRTIGMLQYGLGYYGYLRSTRSADTPGSSSGQETYPPGVLPEDLAGLDQVAQTPKAYDGPFQTIVLIGAYHYLYWGSVRCGQAFLSHREILSRLAGLCTDRVIFSARLRIADLPEGLRSQALGSSAGEDFNAEAFLRTAEDFFQVRQAGYLGNYPAYVLSRQAQKVGSPAIR